MNTKRVALGIATGVAGLALAALAVPAVAGVAPFGPGSPVAQGGMGPGSPGPDGVGMGYGGMGNGGMGYGGGRMNPAMPNRGAGVCPNLTGVAQGTLTPAQKTTLQAMAEEEKLAGDLYQAFADKYSAAVVFDRIAAAEDQHLTAVRTLLDRYGVSDPTAGKAAGQFATASVQATYDRLLAQGLTGQAAALSVGQQVEQADITDLEQALKGLEAPDALRVYQRLLAASRQHLDAFAAWQAR